MCKDGDRYKEIWLAVRVVKGLQQLNDKKNAKLDLKFLMGLLIGFCTVKTIKENTKIEEGISNLAKGNKISSDFEWYTNFELNIDCYFSYLLFSRYF